MLFSFHVIAVVSLLPFLVSADGAEAGLNIKRIDLSRKRQASSTGGTYVQNYTQCTQVCDGYFGKPSSTPVSVTNNNAVVVSSTTSVSKSSTSTTRSSSSSSSTRLTTSVPISSTRASSATVSTTRATSAAVSTTRPSSAAISSATTVISSAAPAATSAGGVTSAQKQQLLDLHNAERKDYGASALTWNTQLEQYALDYAKKCQWKHSGGPYGENLAASYGWPDAIAQGLSGWNNERSQYNPASPMYSHWTQVVWKGTSQVGCALVKCPAGSIQPSWPITDSLVCSYQTPGNYAGQYGTNVGTKV